MFPYSTILNPLFWIIMGLLYAFLIISVRYWMKDMRIKMSYLKWIFLTIWFILLNITIAGGFTLFGENEMKGGSYFLGFFGIIVIILGVGLWRWIVSGKIKENGKTKA